MTRHEFKTMQVDGKPYVQINERIKFFRESGLYNGWSMKSKIHSLDEDNCVICCEIADPEGRVVATGYAQEDRLSTKINRTSYVENCETSAWGRALANLGIGVDTSVASSEEVEIAIGKQGLPEEKPATVKPEPRSEMSQEAKSALTAAEMIAPQGLAPLQAMWGGMSKEVRKQLSGSKEWADVKAIAEAVA